MGFIPTLGMNFSVLVSPCVGKGLAIEQSPVQGILQNMGGERDLGPYSSAVLPYKMKNKLHTVFTTSYDKNTWFNHVLENNMKRGGKNWQEN
jgi:hypothetical protein